MTYLLKFCFLSSPFFITLSLAFSQDNNVTVWQASVTMHDPIACGV